MYMVIKVYFHLRNYWVWKVLTNYIISWIIIKLLKVPIPSILEWLIFYRFLTYNPEKRISADEANLHEYFKESPHPIDPSMFPTWPAKSEQSSKKKASSPKPPSGGKAYAKLMVSWFCLQNACTPNYRPNITRSKFHSNLIKTSPWYWYNDLATAS